MKLCFTDTETTSLRHDRRAWEIGLIVREPGKADAEWSWFIDSADLDLGNADPMSLKIGRFHDRHPQYMDHPLGPGLNGEQKVLRMVEYLTRGAHLVGGVPNFDAEVIGNRMRACGICPSWHYHLIDFETLVIGYLHGRRARQNEIVDGYPLENEGKEAPGLVRWNDPIEHGRLPWKSDELSRAIGVEPPGDDERHTALGDARWAARAYDAVTGSSSRA